MRHAPLLLFLGCNGAPPPIDAPDDTGAPPVEVEPTEAQLAAFYTANGGPDAFPPGYRAAIEALLYGQDDIVRGDFERARARVDAIFAERPLYDDVWYRDHPLYDLNVGSPLAYYGLRMLRQIVDAGPQPTTATLVMTAVVAPCATVTRPTLPDLAPETVQLDVDPQILADDARILHQSTDLFRRWVHAITSGSEVELVVHRLESCTTVSLDIADGVVLSYPDSGQMIREVPADLAKRTDLWWVVAPSGVPGDGSDFDLHFITGGMGGHGAAPLFLSDDAWFTRKVAHLGKGPYSDVERRVYQPQWFQHEFMHHLFRSYPEYRLEETGHQWFDRATWPDDFEGRWEPDYYAEAIEKRLAGATPSLAKLLDQPDPVDVRALGAEALVGRYVHAPRQNDWHEVTVTRDGERLRWSNAAGVSWGLEIRGTELWATEDCPYGAQEVTVELDDAGAVAALRFLGGRYARE